MTVEDSLRISLQRINPGVGASMMVFRFKLFLLLALFFMAVAFEFTRHVLVEGHTIKFIIPSLVFYGVIIVLLVLWTFSKIEKQEAKLRKYSENLQQIVEERVKELKALKEFNEEIVKNVPVGIFTINKRGDITFVSFMCQQIFNAMGYEIASGLNVLEWQAIRALGLRGRFKRALDGGSSFKVPKVNTNRGRLTYLAVQCVPLRSDNEEVNGFLVLIQDVSETVQLEEEVIRIKDERIKLLKRQQDYMNEVAHRLRNPLQVFKGYLEMMDTSTFTPEQRKLFGRIVNSSRRVEEMIKVLTRRKHLS